MALVSTLRYDEVIGSIAILRNPPIMTVVTDEAIPPTENPAIGSPYVSYAYSYPHKTAYRRLNPVVPLSTVWQEERRDGLFLYLHIPFCEHRCGFCNLFTAANPEDGLVGRYLRQLHAEAQQVRDSIGPRTFAQMAIGGGTPSFLTLPELQKLFGIVNDVMEATTGSVPLSFEVSPATIDREKLEWLRHTGVTRVSMGVESFDDATAHRMGRPQNRSRVEDAIELLQDIRFPTLNLDLIYGTPGQSTDDWLKDVSTAIRYSPEELYLYPLYVRPLTGLANREQTWDEQRLTAYRAARDLLLNTGYEQVSMRMFRRCSQMDSVATPDYHCQTDGMIGLGCGARSYSQSLHYSTEYAVRRNGVRAILGDYINRDAASFRSAQHGFHLAPDDRQRRFVVLSLLQAEGLSRREYQDQFQSDVLEHLPELQTLQTSELAVIDAERITLTPAGLERSDAIGPWLNSVTVRNHMREYELK
ncbi:STM4012 family radical SAM protein [Thalassoroseus pseudoceratinae]|uniref:STM4012 family radical SAM protein n=1 Tax=Thalassoroseus pseudoceratinae TaxID=2713176 RepID=UPI001F10EBBB|nr:STM4012 family radical SAM protein [Thalassoroseus pseudoceratinae]